MKEKPCMEADLLSAISMYKLRLAGAHHER